MDLKGIIYRYCEWDRSLGRSNCWVIIKQQLQKGIVAVKKSSAKVPRKRGGYIKLEGNYEHNLQSIKNTLPWEFKAEIPSTRSEVPNLKNPVFAEEIQIKQDSDLKSHPLWKFMTEQKFFPSIPLGWVLWNRNPSSIWNCNSFSCWGSGTHTASFMWRGAALGFLSLSPDISRSHIVPSAPIWWFTFYKTGPGSHFPALLQDWMLHRLDRDGDMPQLKTAF